MMTKKIAAHHNAPRTIDSLASELAYIRMAGFTTTPRFERWMRSVVAMAESTRFPVSEVFGRVSVLAGEIQLGDKRSSNAQSASESRSLRRAV